MQSHVAGLQSQGSLAFKAIATGKFRLHTGLVWSQGAHTRVVDRFVWIKLVQTYVFVERAIVAHSAILDNPPPPPHPPPPPPPPSPLRVWAPYGLIELWKPATALAGLGWYCEKGHGVLIRNGSHAAAWAGLSNGRLQRGSRGLYTTKEWSQFGGIAGPQLVSLCSWNAESLIKGTRQVFTVVLINKCRNNQH